MDQLLRFLSALLKYFEPVDCAGALMAGAFAEVIVLILGCGISLATLVSVAAFGL